MVINDSILHLQRASIIRMVGGGRRFKWRGTTTTTIQKQIPHAARLNDHKLWYE